MGVNSERHPKAMAATTRSSLIIFAHAWATATLLVLTTTASGQDVIRTPEPVASTANTADICFTSGEVTYRTTASNRAALVVLVVDESYSMHKEQVNMDTFGEAMENRLKEKGFGAGSRKNLYSIVGFARPGPGRGGHFLQDNSHRTVFEQSTFREASSKLVADPKAKEEDGYRAIVTATQELAKNTSLVGMERILVLVTDEDRDVLTDRAPLTFDTVFRQLNSQNWRTHVIVYSHFLCDGEKVLGISSDNVAYVADAQQGVTECPRPWSRIGSSYVATRPHYIELAQRLSGSAWDVRKFRQGRLSISQIISGITTVVANQVSAVAPMQRFQCDVCRCDGRVRQCFAAHDEEECVCMADGKQWNSETRRCEILSEPCESEAVTYELNANRAAMVLLIVDESHSMRAEHRSMDQFAETMEEKLRGKGFGTGDKRNKFSIVGFGQSKEPKRSGHFLTDGARQHVFTASTFHEACSHIFSDPNGHKEDGYRVIAFALDRLQRDTNLEGMEKILVLVTDEDRDALSFPGGSHTHSSTLRRLQAGKWNTHIFVDGRYTCNDQPALGISSDNITYVGDALRGTTPCIGKSSLGKSYAKTHEHYIELARQVGGSSWDVEHFQRGQQGIDTIISAVTSAAARKSADDTFVSRIRCDQCTCQEGDSECRPALDQEECVCKAGPNQKWVADKRQCMRVPTEPCAPGGPTFVLEPSKPLVEKTANVLVVMDESLSMDRHFRFSRNFVGRLETNLTSRGFANVEYSLVGFGHAQYGGRGRVIKPSGRSRFPASSFPDAIAQLAVGAPLAGNKEDGYDAMHMALQLLPAVSPENDANVLILITDEGRDNINKQLGKAEIKEELEKHNVKPHFFLHVDFTCEALGLGSFGEAFSAHCQNGERATVSSPHPDSARGDAVGDYASLALDLGGAVWDVNKLTDENIQRLRFTGSKTEIAVTQTGDSVEASIVSCTRCPCQGENCKPVVETNKQICECLYHKRQWDDTRDQCV